ncbi:universal stress protein [Runella slithyformis]|uniref:UspA domain-containing protein n=1 Tax=Runella slithyformis (strain ATCC 29530 / DSM 19594 / LMG 11500 / NCIMB 11436 / LSU 4) TaxID=761193 RepID=A0A7U3ZMF7_RUNSL|nr:universal stress protein [Runella slithyformis]AEI49921.1 UspA domain-containing protein [Runella slithyformis DSM 19594]
MNTSALQTLLVPIDFGEASLNALQTAVAMAGRHRAKLLLVHVVTTDSVIVFPEGGMIMDTGLDASVKSAVLKLEELVAQLLMQHPLSCTYDVMTGSVTGAIVEIAIRKHADLIVIGSYGTSELRAFLIGSNVFSILKNAPCPVLTVPPHRQWLQFKNILFPVRPVVNALEKYGFARKIIERNQARLIVLGVLERLDNHSFEELNLEASNLIQQLEKDGVQLRAEFHFCDSPAETIVEKAHELQVDLLVVTGSLEYQLKEFFIGPFAQQVINHANVPVLFIRPSVNAPTKEQSVPSDAYLHRLS